MENKFPLKRFVVHVSQCEYMWVVHVRARTALAARAAYIMVMPSDAPRPDIERDVWDIDASSVKYKHWQEGEVYISGGYSYKY